MEFLHKSVLPDECIENLKIKSDGVYVDATLGGAGHSAEICRRISGGKLIGIDTDGDALEKAKDVLREFGDRAVLVKGNYSQFKNIMADLGIKSVDGILLDLGVSSYQLDEPERGFSYMRDGRLDMRMDKNAEFSAYDVVNGYGAKELTRIIGEYGEERWAKRIAEFIVEAAKKKPIETTFELVDIIKGAVPKSARQDGPHPAKRTFQAIRIEVNSELDILKRVLPDMAESLSTGGRICVISFHSLEDRIVKHVFRDLENPCNCPPELPMCICNKRPIVKVITRKPILPSKDEEDGNHRSRSAKLRVAEKV